MRREPPSTPGAGVTVEYRPIGRIASPWTRPAGAPIQPAAARGIEGILHVDPAFVAGLRDLDGFSHAIVLYHLHLVRGSDLTVVPFLDTESHGIFATRSPKRPNAIGLSVFRIVSIDGSDVRVNDVDAVDGSPILDIKPYVPAFDAPDAACIGWVADRLDDITTARADARFSEEPAERARSG